MRPRSCGPFPALGSHRAPLTFWGPGTDDRRREGSPHLRNIRKTRFCGYCGDAEGVSSRLCQCPPVRFGTLSNECKGFAGAGLRPALNPVGGRCCRTLLGDRAETDTADTASTAATPLPAAMLAVSAKSDTAEPRSRPARYRSLAVSAVSAELIQNPDTAATSALFPLVKTLSAVSAVSAVSVLNPTPEECDSPDHLGTGHALRDAPAAEGAGASHTRRPQTRRTTPHRAEHCQCAGRPVTRRALQGLRKKRKRRNKPADLGERLRSGYERTTKEALRSHRTDRAQTLLSYFLRARHEPVSAGQQASFVKFVSFVPTGHEPTPRRTPATPEPPHRRPPKPGTRTGESGSSPCPPQGPNDGCAPGSTARDGGSFPDGFPRPPPWE